MAKYNNCPFMEHHNDALYDFCRYRLEIVDSCGGYRGNCDNCKYNEGRTMTPDALTPDAFAKKMQKIVKDNMNDTETIHYLLDNLMCEVLTSLGYKEGVEIFKKAPRWYA